MIGWLMITSEGRVVRGYGPDDEGTAHVACLPGEHLIHWCPEDTDDPDVVALLAAESSSDVLALSVAVLSARLPDLTDVEVRAALDGEARGRGRRDALASIAAEIRRRGL